MTKNNSPPEVGKTREENGAFNSVEKIRGIIIYINIYTREREREKERERERERDREREREREI